MSYLFVPPTVEEGPIGPHRLHQFFTLTRGISVLKIAGEYFEVRTPSQDEIDEAEITYLGGHEYVVSNAEASDLTTAGYGSNLTLL